MRVQGPGGGILPVAGPMILWFCVRWRCFNTFSVLPPRVAARKFGPRRLSTPRRRARAAYSYSRNRTGVRFAWQGHVIRALLLRSSVYVTQIFRRRYSDFP